MDKAPAVSAKPEVDQLEEIWEWLESFDAVIEAGGAPLAARILEQLRDRAKASGVALNPSTFTPVMPLVRNASRAPSAMSSSSHRMT